MPFRSIPKLLLTLALALAIPCPPVVAGTGRADAGPPASVAPSADDPAEPTLAELVGHKLVIRMHGTAPSSSLLGRVRRGEVGGIVLFGFNTTTRSALIAATRRLQAAAADGGQPPLLIMADQEGGAVRTILWAPTARSARQLGADGRTAYVYERGAAAGAGLLRSGVNVALAPVADVPVGSDSFMRLAGRTFSSSATKTARLAVAFAEGLASEGVAATMKHFPGIGRVRLNTDRHVQVVTASRASLEADLVPFRRAIARDVPVIMLSNATYSALDPDNAAGWSHAIATTLLRDELGFTGVTITDSLSGTAAARGERARALALRATIAGTDMVMLTGTESATEAAFAYLLAKAEAGAIPIETLRASYDRIAALKEASRP